MKTKNQKPVTPGSVLAEVKEMFAESRAATELSRIEFEKRMAESQAAAEKIPVPDLAIMVRTILGAIAPLCMHSPVPDHAVGVWMVQAVEAVREYVVSNPSAVPFRRIGTWR